MLQTDGAWIVEVDGIPAGFSMVILQERTIYALFVRPEYEGLGVGRMLLTTAERWLTEHGMGEAWLGTGNNRAIRAHHFYRQAGWQEDGKSPEGEVRYRKQLS